MFRIKGTFLAEAGCAGLVAALGFLIALAPGSVRGEKVPGGTPVKIWIAEEELEAGDHEFIIITSEQIGTADGFPFGPVQEGVVVGREDPRFTRRVLVIVASQASPLPRGTRLGSLTFDLDTTVGDVVWRRYSTVSE